MRYDHFLITRFNLRETCDPNSKALNIEWLNRRLDLFERFCLPSIAGQTTDNFRWIVEFDEATPASVQKRIDGYRSVCKTFVPHYFPPAGPNAAREVVKELVRDDAQLLVTTRVDNDDGLCRTYIEGLQRHVQVSQRTVLQYARGYIWYAGKLYLDRQPHNAFSTLIEPLENLRPEDILTVYTGAHTEIHELGPVIDVSDEPAWLQVVHGGNLANQLRGVRVPITDLDKGFDLPHLVHPESAVDLMVDGVGSRVKMAAWGSARAVRNRLRGTLAHS